MHSRRRFITNSFAGWTWRNLAAIQADEFSGRQRLLAVILQLIGEQSAPLSAPDRDRLGHDILDEVFGLGPLEPLLHDPTVSDILVNTL